MKTFDLNLTHNPLKTRQDLATWTMDILRPLEAYFHRSDTRLHLANVSSGARDTVSEVEGFSRILWALGAMKEIGIDDSLWLKIRRGLVCGTDPKHPDYFGDLGDYDQRLVETAAIAYCFVLRPEAIYEPLSTAERENLITWMRGINEKKAHACNWKFFRVMVNIGFMALGLQVDKRQMEEHLDEMEDYYFGEGWYRDGLIEAAHADYYVPFAMHYYGLFYAQFMEAIDPVRAKRYRERAQVFARDFVYWFDSKGRALPYGRSLTYRFAQVSFWCMVVVSGLETEFSLGEIKGMILRHLREWQKQPIFDAKGVLTLGYNYPNQFMTEEYNAPGSVYWALKTMVLLSLEDDHPFWQAIEAPLPKLDSRRLQVAPRLILVRSEQQNHLIAYNPGHLHTNGHTHVECKYEKFAYSTHFGFSVPRSHKNLRFGAFDSTLAVSEDGQYYRHKEKSLVVRIENDYCVTQWKPFADVKISTTLVYGFPWHIRIHVIETEREINLAEGGFAFGLENMGEEKTFHTEVKEGLVKIISATDYVGIQNIVGFQNAEIINAAANTNLINARTLIPTLTASLNPGRHVLVSLVYGDEGEFNEEDLPAIVLEQDDLYINNTINFNLS